MNDRWIKPFLLTVLLALSLFGLLLPRAFAPQNCQIQFTSVDFPTAVAPGQSVNIKSQLSVTCKTSAIDIAGTVDLLNDANASLSAQGIHVGFIAEPQKTVNFTIINSAKAPSTTGLWKLRVSVSVYASGLIVGSAEKLVQIQVGQLPTQTSASTSSRTTSSTTTTTTPPPSNLPIGTLGLVLGVVAVAIVGSFFVLMKRKKSPGTTVTTKQELFKEGPPKEKTRPPIPDEKNISTGYQELDAVLEGGLPVGYAVLILSPSCDEKDLLLRRIIESGLKTGRKVFFVSRDLSKVQDLAAQNPNGFFAFSPQVDKTAAPQSNIMSIASVQNLSDINIALGKAIESLAKGEANKIMVLDILNDVLLENKALTTRKWLADSILKRKAEGFTILGILNPEVASKQDSQTIIEIFDGIIEIYEKELRERARRFLIVKKMFGRRYAETELMLDKNKLF
jgi:KaiC/GvpD/RAD55 family RecA-like ATPase